MSNFSIVILHYKAKDVTLESVKSALALSQDEGNIDVVVVENGCKDGVEEYLRRNLSSCDLSRLHVVVSDENLGFAQGNNLGYAYAKGNLAPDFVIIANNDVVFTQDDMCDRIAASYSRRRFHVLGPDIFNPLLGVHQSPCSAHMPVTTAYVDELKRGFEVRLANSYKREAFLGLKYRLMATSLGRCLHKAKLASKANSTGWDKAQEGVELQGSCVIFSYDYLSQMDWAFYPGTFMYLEELISLYMSEVQGFTHVYDPSVRVQHMHGISTALDFPNQVEKHRFFLEENLKSVEVLRGLMGALN